LEQITSKSTVISVDLIRTLAIFLVIVIHASAEQPTIYQLPASGGTWMWWTANIYDSLARCSVPLFVIVSGFLLLDFSKTKESTRSFFKKRVIRIVPPLLFWATIYFAWRFFVNGESVTPTSVFQDLLTGDPYFHFPFLYTLFGLYLITPILRPAIAYSNERVDKYLIILSFISSAVIPLIGLFAPINFNSDLFIFGGWVGYFILGVYLPKVRARSSLSLSIFLLGFLWTAVGTWILTLNAGGQMNDFFYNYLSMNVVLTASAVFLLLCQISPQWLDSRLPKFSQVISLIGQSTLAIYLFHVIVLETFQRGLIGLRISITTLNPILEIPLISIITFGICLAIILPLKKAPIINKLIG
jgi:surface polysaccharide O-acyltransferase-like enzyme